MRKAELLAAIGAIVVGGPLIFVFARAMADGQARAAEAPMRAILGEDAYETLSEGDQHTMHYMGEDRSAPDFVLRDKDGNEWRMSDQEGKVVVMNFWTITCQPCVEEMPSLIQLAEMVEGRDDVELIAVTTDESWAQVAQLFPEDSKLKVLFDPEREVVNGKFGTRLFPETWFVDPNGVIRLRYDGPKDWASPVVLELIEGLS